MAVSSSSSSSGAPTTPVWLYQVVAFNQPLQRVALVEVPIVLPPLIQYLGNNYVWSRIYWGYVYTPPAVVQASGRTEIISQLADPQF